MSGAELASLISVFLMGAAALVTAITTSRSAATKAQLEVLAQTIEIVQNENKRLLLRIENLESELEERDGSLAQVQEWAELLIAQVRSLGGNPVPMPCRDQTKPHRRVNPQ